MAEASTPAATRAVVATHDASPAATRALVAAGLGVALVSDLADVGPGDGAAVLPLTPQPTHVLIAALRPGALASPTTRALASLLVVA